MSVVSTFAFVLSLLAIGRFLRWRESVPENAHESLNLVVLHVCLPAAILLHAPTLVFKRELIGLVAIPWLVLLASIAVVLPLARWLRFDRGSTACLLVLIPLGNTSFIGYALIPALAGAAVLPYAVVYDQFGSFLILVTWGLTVVAVLGGAQRPTLALITKRIATFPPFIALVLALTLMPVQPPPGLAWSLQMLADALLPIVVLALGMQLRLRLPREHLLPLTIGLLAKLVLMPLLALAFAVQFGLSPEMRLAAVYETAMPPMVTAGVLLAMAGLSPQLAAALVGYGVVGSMLTLPLWYLLLAR